MIKLWVKVYFAIIGINLFGCSSIQTNRYSFWESQKDKFRFQHRKEFTSDSSLRIELAQCNAVRHRCIDTIFSSKKVFLFSWQKRIPTTNEFTVIIDDGELGLTIFYIVCNKSDEVLSVFPVAGAGNEAGFIYETRSRFTARDSILQVTSATQWLANQVKLSKTRGDSTFLSITLDSMGIMREHIIKEVKELTNNEK